MKMKMTRALVLATFTLFAITGCTGEKSDDNSTEDSAAVEQVDASQFVLAAAPDNALTVLAVKDSAENGDDVVISGRIGGSSHPFVDGVAAFTIVDAALPACNDEEDCGCSTPWDYCCETADAIAKHSATIKFTGDDQRPRRFDPRTIFDVVELQTVVVTGKAKRDDAGNLTILAEKIFVKK